MGSSKRHVDETKEERKERKRLKKEAKKEAKKAKKEAKKRSKHLSSPPSLSSSPPPLSSSSYSWSSSEPSLIFQKRVRFTLSILPGNLDNVYGSILGKLRSMFLKYVDGLDGILLAYDASNVEALCQGRGRILEELPHIHYSLQVSVMVFQPRVGAFVVGDVTESFHSHLSCIVLQHFNASISAKELTTTTMSTTTTTTTTNEDGGFVFDTETEQWTFQGRPLEKGKTQIRFRIEKMHESGGIISMDGSSPSYVQEKI